MSALRTAFEVESREVGDDRQRRPHIVARCRRCGASEAIPIASHCGSVPAEFGERMFRKRLWRLGATRTKDECPTCRGSAQIAALPPEERWDAAHEKEAAIQALQAAPITEPIILPQKEDPMSERSASPSVETKRSRADISRENLARVNASRTPEERSRIGRLGAQAAHAARAVRRKRHNQGGALRAYWADKSPEERTAIAKARAAAVALKKKQSVSSETPQQEELFMPTMKVAAPVMKEAPSRPAPVAETTKVSPSRPTLVAEAPPRATREDNRRIHEALSEHYDEQRERYTGAMRDRKLAEMLNVPAAWVAQVREQFYGPDRSDTDEQQRQEIQRLWREVSELETSTLKMMEAVDEQKAAVRKVALAAGVMLT